MNRLSGLRVSEVLRELDSWVNSTGGPNGALRLWHVLTALRGPDINDPGDAEKFALTAPIRRSAVPLMARKAGAFVTNSTSIEGLRDAYATAELLRTKVYEEHEDLNNNATHYYNHVIHALEILMEEMEQDHLDAIQQDYNLTTAQIVRESAEASNAEAEGSPFTKPEVF